MLSFQLIHSLFSHVHVPMLSIRKALLNHSNFHKKKKKLVLFRYCNRVYIMTDRFDGFLPVLGLPAPPRGGLPDRTYQQ